MMCFCVAALWTCGPVLRSSSLWKKVYMKDVYVSDESDYDMSTVYRTRYHTANSKTNAALLLPVIQVPSKFQCSLCVCRARLGYNKKGKQ